MVAPLPNRDADIEAAVNMTDETPIDDDEGMDNWDDGSGIGFNDGDESPIPPEPELEVEAETTPEGETVVKEETEVEEEPEEKGPVSSGWAAVVKERSKNQKTKEELVAREKELNGHAAKLKEVVEKNVSLAQLFAQNPREALSQIGVSYKQLTEAILKGEGINGNAAPVQQAAPVQTMEQMFQKMEERLTEKLTGTRISGEAEAILTRPEFELLAATEEAPTQIRAFIKGYKEQHDTDLTTEQAATYLQKQREEEIQNLLSLGPVKKLLGTNGTPPTPAKKNGTKSMPLTNRTPAGNPDPSSVDFDDIEDESPADALRAAAELMPDIKLDSGF